MKRRNTPAKEAVLQVLTDTGKAMSQDAIEKQIDIDINRTTIYRVLNRFCQDGILHKVVAEDGKQYFARCVESHEKDLTKPHFHFRCVVCETIECLPEEVEFSISEGYLIENINCVLSGRCKDCA